MLNMYMLGLLRAYFPVYASNVAQQASAGPANAPAQPPPARTTPPAGLMDGVMSAIRLDGQIGVRNSF